MNIHPLNGYCVLKPIKPKDKTEGGILIPEDAQEKTPYEGEVIAIPESNLTSNGTNLPIEVKVGDRVLFGRFAGEAIEVDGEEYKIVELTAIHAVVKN